MRGTITTSREEIMITTHDHAVFLVINDPPSLLVPK
jgi:hypothetical protein